uniref:Tf2-1-like SH3-like domain-containing protein n=1 Tax=Rhizophora mucronata TaxID=61149 RepID=A0A2P2IN90_RHIMU
MPRVEGPFKVLERIGDNAYNIDLLGYYNDSWNVKGLFPYLVDNDLLDLRTNPSQLQGV